MLITLIIFFLVPDKRSIGTVDMLATNYDSEEGESPKNGEKIVILFYVYLCDAVVCT